MTMLKSSNHGDKQLEWGIKLNSVDFWIHYLQRTGLDYLKQSYSRLENLELMMIGPCHFIMVLLKKYKKNNWIQKRKLKKYREGMRNKGILRKEILVKEGGGIKRNSLLKGREMTFQKLNLLSHQKI